MGHHFRESAYRPLLEKKLTMSCCRVILVVVSAITPPWLASVMMNFKRGHRERFDALIAPIPTPFATLVLAFMLVAL